MALVIGSFTGDSDPAPSATADPQAVLTFDAPPRADAEAAACAKVLAQLPITLTGLAQRVVHTKPDTPFVVAWGDPAVVFRCGVARPKSLRPGSAEQFFAGGSLAGPYYERSVGPDDTNVFTTVDRAAYISLTVPRRYNGKQLPPLSAAIAKVLPAVCSTDSATTDVTTLCTRRR